MKRELQLSKKQLNTESDKRIPMQYKAIGSSGEKEEKDLTSVSSEKGCLYEYDVKSDIRLFYGKINSCIDDPVGEASHTQEEWKARVHPDDLENLSKAWEQCLESGEIFYESYRIKRDGGDYRLFEEHSIPIEFEEGRPVKFIGACSDLTGRARDRRFVKARLRFEAFISDLSATFVNLPAGRVDKEIECKLKYLVEYMNLDRGSLLQFSNKGTKIYLTHAYVIPEFKELQEKITDEILKIEQEPWSDRNPWYSKKLRQGEIICFTTDDLPDEARHEKQYCLAFGAKTGIGIPVIVGGTIQCALIFGSYRTDTSWPDSLIQRLRLVGEIFANALQRKKAEQELKKAYYEIKKLKNQVEAERDYLQEEIKLEHNFHEIIGKSGALKNVLYKVEQVAPTDTTVLILGETGTGKELVVRAVHDASKRRNRPLIKVNCATLPSNIIENELFGHEKGAFTGARNKRVGRFELADGATIFLDEIGELPMELQPKLLRVIQDGEFERLGSSRTIKVDVRIIAATNRNPDEEVKNGRFRQDLYYRLNVFPISIPPIRNREEDIPILLNHFVNKYCKKAGKQTKTISPYIIKSLLKYEWPGNVRELENLIERAVIISNGSQLQIEVPKSLDKPDHGKRLLEDIEYNHILRVLEETGWKIEGQNGAAQAVGLKPSTLRTRMKKLGIQRPQGSKS